MAVTRVRSRLARLDEWRVTKKIKPGQRGAIKLSRSYGQALLCVRYRENHDGTERLTTIELVIERVIIQKRDDPIVLFKIRSDELALRNEAMRRGAKYDPIRRMWRLSRSEVLRMGLNNRIAVTPEELLREHVHV